MGPRIAGTSETRDGWNQWDQGGQEPVGPGRTGASVTGWQELVVPLDPAIPGPGIAGSSGTVPRMAGTSGTKEGWN